ncbi:unnamed protein product [Macrosiphum euphorbiae]|uniref:Uncharacterized protein n=1 Tax=Macrosiphum euphorbiae TaxID=13131 RepID=A0AAV0X9V6_9HEMI|nr:unnamed protein product [Macrosiphum euphorbiae]
MEITSEGCAEFVAQALTQHGSMPETEEQTASSLGVSTDNGLGLPCAGEAENFRRQTVSIAYWQTTWVVGPRFRFYISIFNQAPTAVDALKLRRHYLYTPSESTLLVNLKLL